MRIFTEMKILHLNTYDGNGGAGRASYRLNKALKASGADSDLYTFIKLGNSVDIKALYPGPIHKALAILNILLERYLPKIYKKNIKVPFSLQFFGKDIHHHPKVKEANIIHLHWVNHGFLSPRSLKELAKLNKPIVWTMHDCNVFTGGCHVRFGCENYLNTCGNCPFLKKPNEHDISNQTLLKKREAYNLLNLNIVSPSNWLGESAKRSSLLKAFPVNVIPNTLETNIFKPSDKTKAKELFDIATDKFVILSGFMPSKNDSHKGTDYLVKALNQWVTKYPQIASKALLVIFGNKDNNQALPIKVPTLFLGTINDDSKLAQAYSAADLFITPSLDDNLPNTVMESMACGTPIVAFKTGGIPDMVDHHTNGYLADYKNSLDLMNGIQWVYNHPDRNSLSEQARMKVMSTFSEEKIAEQHIALYKQILKSASPNNN